MVCNQATEIIITVVYIEIITDAQMNQKCEQKKYNGVADKRSPQNREAT
jgi:hypothetical protein